MTQQLPVRRGFARWGNRFGKEWRACLTGDLSQPPKQLGILFGLFKGVIAGDNRPRLILLSEPLRYAG